VNTYHYKKAKVKRMTTYHFSKAGMIIKSGVDDAYAALVEAYDKMYSFDEANGVECEAESDDYQSARAAYKEAYLEYDRLYGLYGA